MIPGSRPVATRSHPWLRRTLAAATPILAGCGGGLPLLHPAQTLDVGQVRASAGVSGQFAAGGLADAWRDALNEASSNQVGSTAVDPVFVRGALVAASIGPGLAPVAGARVGLGQAFEAGLGYTGRAVRIDVRRSFDLSGHWALSLGAGGSAALYGRPSSDALPDVDLDRLHGWGADVPLLVGYRSDGDLYSLWLGARTGWEEVDISAVRSVPGTPDLGPNAPNLSATRFWGGGLLGLAVGFRHVHVAVELDASYATVSGTFAGIQAQVSGLTLAPAGCLWWDF